MAMLVTSLMVKASDSMVSSPGEVPCKHAAVFG